MIRRVLAVLTLTVAALGLVIGTASAGSPHFVNSATVVTVDGNTLTVQAKEAGLGDETQIHVTLTADALCINNGGNHPKAVNKAGVAAAADVPVQNGKADITLTGTATFQPECAPPMTVEFANIVVTDETNGLVLNL